MPFVDKSASSSAFDVTNFTCHKTDNKYSRNGEGLQQMKRLPYVSAFVFQGELIDKICEH